MGLFSPLKKLFRADKGAPQSLKDPGEWLTSWFGGKETTSGVSVTPTTALQSSAVLACVRVISESVASLPLKLYRKNGDSREPVTNHPLYDLLHSSPNNDQTSFEFREMLQSHLTLRGNAYAFVDYSQTGKVLGLFPLHPDRVRVLRRGGDLVFEYKRQDNGGTELFRSNEILHLKGLSSDGIMGLSPIDMAREAIGLSLAAEEFGGRFFSNNTHIGNYVEHPGQLSDKAYANLKEFIQNEYTGLANANRPFILEEGMKLGRLNMTASDAQFLESRKFQISEIARIFRVPPHMIGDLERATFSNIEQQSIDFVTHSIRPWLVRWEQRLAHSLLSETERQNHYFEFKLDALLRGETKSRQEALQIQRRNGVISANEWRAMENMNPLSGPEGESIWADLSLAGNADQTENNN